ncbi:MAG: sigma-54-dependent Fis family transcriptional regulator [Polyangiaceae bacterium]
MERAVRAGQRLLEADARAALATSFHARGAELLAERERLATRAILERTLVALPREIAEAFALHPSRRSALERSPEARTGATDARPHDREARLERLVSIARRLSSSLDPKEVLDMAVDAAIDFTGAERGFIILRGAPLTLLAPRNTGQRALEDAEIAFSRGIAERVLETGEPIVTVDAQRDERFALQRSIHAMRLSSVMGLPVRGPEGVVAALYLDHRARRGAFDRVEIDLVLALADHVATALSSARLHAALAERTRELEVERARTLELLREKSEEADRLALEVRAREEAALERFRGSMIVGRSAPMQRLFEKIARVSSAAVSVLVTGESGTGKELVARAIHAESARKGRPFVAINCGAIPEQLLESELFGYRAGAFTGAAKDRDGLFLAANGGTLFLDEIGEMAPSLQVKLLRVLQNREVQALGAPHPVPIDVRLITATHRDLRVETAAGRFREDLYYRVAVVEITVPALRDRLDDLVWLTPALLARAARELGRPAPEVARDAMSAMMRHDWPGNVRELENVLTKAMVLADREVIHASDLGLDAAPARPRASAPLTRKAHQADEQRRIEAALRASNFNVSEACRSLGIPRATMYRKLKRGAPG